MIVTAPDVPTVKTGLMIFLAGTIDNGDSEDWQARCAEELSEVLMNNGLTEDEFVIVNPRRKNWNAGASQDLIIDQIVWEQTMIEKSTIVLFNILGSSKSPVTLLELGQCLGSRRTTFIACEPSFWRHTNVAVTCIRNNVLVWDTLDEVMTAMLNHLQNSGQLS